MNSTKYCDIDICNLTYAAVRGLCKDNGIPAKGKKVDLVNALKAIPQFSDSTILSEQQPLFGDISHIKPSTSTVLVLSEDDDKENDEKVLPAKKTNVGPVRRKGEHSLKEISDDIRNKEDELQRWLQKFEDPVKMLCQILESKKKDIDKSKHAGEDYLNILLGEKLTQKENELQRKHKEKELELKRKHEDLKRKHEGDIKELQSKKQRTEDSLKETFRTTLATKNSEILEARVFKIKAGAEQKKRVEQEAENIRISNQMKLLRTEVNTLKLSANDLNEKLTAKDREINEQATLIRTINANANDKILEDMEDEFTCVICQELFISTSTLPCGHSFCEMCLRTWFKTKRTCPVCRHNVTVKALTSVVINSAIERFVDNMDANNKLRRTTLLRERNEEMRRSDAAPDPTGVRKMFYKVGDPSEGPLAVPVAVTSAAPVNRRRSRSQSPSRLLANRHVGGVNPYNPLQNNNGNNYIVNRYVPTAANNNFQTTNIHNNTNNPHYRIRCFACGQNHHIRNCPNRY